MLREVLLEELGNQVEIQAIEVDPDPVELLPAVDRYEADVVVISLDESGDPGICSHLLAEYPSLLIIALSPSQERAILYRQVITREELHPLSAASLLTVIRERNEEKDRPLSKEQQ